MHVLLKEEGRGKIKNSLKFLRGKSKISAKGPSKKKFYNIHT